MLKRGERRGAGERWSDDVDDGSRVGRGSCSSEVRCRMASRRGNEERNGLEDDTVDSGRVSRRSQHSWVSKQGGSVSLARW